MKRLFTVAMVVGACVGVFYLVGLISPRIQSAGARVAFASVPSQIFPIVADVDAWDRWFPGIVLTEERPERNRHPVWRLSDAQGRSWDLEVIVSTEPNSWVGTYELDEQKCTLRFDVKWYGEGALVLVRDQRDARSPWVRARRLAGSQDAVMSEALAALGRQLGESVTPE